MQWIYHCRFSVEHIRKKCIGTNNQGFKRNQFFAKYLQLFAVEVLLISQKIVFYTALKKHLIRYYRYLLLKLDFDDETYQRHFLAVLCRPQELIQQITKNGTMRQFFVDGAVCILFSKLCQVSQVTYVVKRSLRHLFTFFVGFRFS